MSYDKSVIFLLKRFRTYHRAVLEGKAHIELSIDGGEIHKKIPDRLGTQAVDKPRF